MHAAEFPLEVGRRGYAVGAAVLQAVLPRHDGPTVAAPVTVTDEGLHLRDGVEAKAIVLEQLARALTSSGTPLLEWVAGTGCSRAVIHFDVDTIDSNEIVLGLGAEANGLTSAEVRRVVADLEQAVDIVGVTVAEFIPRQVMHLQQILKDFPLIDGSQVPWETSP